jgi:hypothetical protein
MQLNPASKIGDGLFTPLASEFITPIIDESGKAVAVYMTIATLRRWNESGIGATMKELNDLLAALDAISNSSR